MPTDECREVIEDLKRNKKNRTFAELARILESFGFTMHPRTKGSHRPFNKPGCPLGLSIPEGGKHVLLPYVRKVIRALEECCDGDEGGTTEERA
jgi:predicted RNA binding protein YcfA (HicA-like mRNA interferase family)